MILVSFYIWLSPSLEKQQIFWEDYLKKYPDNPLKVVLFPIEKSKQVAKIDLLFSFMGNIYTLYSYCNVL
ncbi:hypothetical protein D920_00257 [Enterococcus faecalis 13-SD-W-01]|nr:hypothetical protein D920_00257 [Enterococcus faecalis 13-SD-W-01]